MTIETVDAESVGMSSERIGWARDLLANHVASGRSPSVVTVVLRHGQCVLAEAFGVRGPHGEPLDLDDVWPIASAGKPFTVRSGDVARRGGPRSASTTRSSTTSPS